ncbi:hypothetical protein AURDEDRAFT_175301 [Auricularia subglabra TFB-10046 SS5]|uniref:F-box domain-containing protein n=1 Tax=Auricularia subglabra (strain TFB-10046 / SS5) TaxID=717982 RepID=J0LF56_AURST|nr:hypothetical protein AURDEDRAFT_175301 [Auricularia subglabra TFB-10046 SS5]
MAVQSLVACIPTEILLCILDYYAGNAALDDTEALALLRGPGHVSRAWRAAVHRHPAFSKLIICNGSLPLLIARLDVGHSAESPLGGTEIDLSIWMKSNTPAQTAARRCPSYHHSALELILSIFRVGEAQRLRSLELYFGSVDPQLGALVPPLNDIFARHAPLLKEFVSDTMTLALFAQSEPVPAFRTVETLSLYFAPSGPLSHHTLSAIPNIRRLALKAGSSAPDGDALLASLRLEFLWLWFLPDSWAPTLAALGVESITDVVFYGYWKHTSAVTLLCHRFSMRLRGALELSLVAWTEPPLRHQRTTPCIAFRSSEQKRTLRFTGRTSSIIGEAASAFIALTELDVARIVRLEVCSSGWREVHRLVPALVGLQVLVLHVHFMDPELSPVACPLLRKVVLQLAAHAPPACFRVKVDDVEYFLSRQVHTADRPTLVVCRPIVLEGNITRLASLVERIEEVHQSLPHGLVR